MDKKVLQVCCDGFENGGIQAVIMSIIRTLNNNYHFDAISFSDGEQYYSKEVLQYGEIYHLKKYNPNNLITKLFKDFLEYRFLYKQSKTFFKLHPDYTVVHCHNYFNAAPILRAAKEAGVTYRIAHSHNVKSIIKEKNPLRKIANLIKRRQIHKYATDMVACSKAAGEYVFGNAKITVINNAIDLNKFNPSNYPQKSNGTIQFVHVGRYGYQKNQLFLLDVFNEFLKLNDNAELTLVGFGIWTEKVKKKISDLELNNKVKMLPSDSNIPEIYAKSDITIYPSTFEGLGISLIEAQAMGLRCYVSEVIQPEANLGLCKVLQLSWGAKKWAEFIYNDIEKNGHEKKFVDMSSYDINNVKKQYDNLYSKVL